MHTNSPIQVPQTLVELVYRFYRPESLYNAKTTNILRPMFTAKSAIKATRTLSTDVETLIAEVASAVRKEMMRIHAGGAAGRWVIKDQDEEYQAIQAFARYYVETLFLGRFRGDKSQLSSERGIGLVEDTFEMLTRLKQAELAKRIKKGEVQIDEKNDEENLENPSLDSLDWEISELDEDQFLICGPGNLEILIDDFDTTKTETTTLPSDSLQTISVSCWIENPTNYTKDSVRLEVVTVSNGLTSRAYLHAGSKISWQIPYEFAKSLQTKLLGESPVLSVGS